MNHYLIVTARDLNSIEISEKVQLLGPFTAEERSRKLDELDKEFYNKGYAVSVCELNAQNDTITKGAAFLLTMP